MFHKRYNLREAENIPENWVSIENPIYIKCGIDCNRSVKNHVPDVATSVSKNRFSWKWEETLGWICDMLFKVPCIIAVFSKASSSSITVLLKMADKHDGQDGGKINTDLRAKTFSYLCTKSTAGICSCTTSHDSEAAMDQDQELQCRKDETYDQKSRYPANPNQVNRGFRE